MKLPKGSGADDALQCLDYLVELEWKLRAPSCKHLVKLKCAHGLCINLRVVASSRTRDGSVVRNKFYEII